jgi:cell wall-associated NlpC family hydrolase
MTNLEQLQIGIEYQCLSPLNIYDSPQCDRLATQAATGRHLQVTTIPDNAPAIEVCLREDDYPGWLPVSDLPKLATARVSYQAIALSITEINNCLPKVINFAMQAMQQPNYYLWGGTLGPNYDCSGLIQAAFVSVGVWLPRDAYQQEAFVKTISPEELSLGDLVFFGTDKKATHVGLYLGAGSYIHSSGQKMGRNGIAIDSLTTEGDAIGRSYFQQLRSYGRVVKCYQGGNKAIHNSQFTIRN